jgi:uncharacterized membrane protein
LSPIGINVRSITISLSGIVLVLAFLALLRKTKIIKPQIEKLHVQRTEQSST